MRRILNGGGRMGDGVRAANGLELHSVGRHQVAQLSVAVECGWPSTRLNPSEL